jgi:hypothetical protein
MKVSIECANCGVPTKADVVGIIRTLIECAERDSIYGGFLCNNCADEESDETIFED